MREKLGLVSRTFPVMKRSKVIIIIIIIMCPTAELEWESSGDVSFGTGDLGRNVFRISLFVSNVTHVRRCRDVIGKKKYFSWKKKDKTTIERNLTRETCMYISTIRLYRILHGTMTQKEKKIKKKREKRKKKKED